MIKKNENNSSVSCAQRIGEMTFLSFVCFRTSPFCAHGVFCLLPKVVLQTFKTVIVMVITVYLVRKLLLK